MDLGKAASAFQLAGLGLDAIGAYYSGKRQKARLRHRAAIDEINARSAESAAQGELERGQLREQSARLQTAQLKSAQRARLAANGIDLSSPTAANVLTSTDVMGEIDANTIAANAIRAAWGLRTEAVGLQNDALLARAGADSVNPLGQAAASLLGNAGQVADSWYRLNRAGGYARDEEDANASDDPIYAFGKKRKWWGS